MTFCLCFRTTQDGLDVLTYELQLLEKVEESVLYVLNNDEELVELERQYNATQVKIEELRMRVNLLRMKIEGLRARNCFDQEFNFTS